MNNKNLNKTDGGFIQLIILLIIVLVVASLYGYGPQYMWDSYIQPIINFIWNIVVAIAEFAVRVIQKAADMSNILEWF